MVGEKKGSKKGCGGVCVRKSLSVKDVVIFFFFKQKTAYEIVSRDWSSDVCSSDLPYYIIVKGNSMSQEIQAVPYKLKTGIVPK